MASMRMLLILVTMSRSPQSTTHHKQVAHTDVVLDDVWSLDLSKLDGWTCVQENTGGEELKDLSDWESDEEDSDSEAE